MTSSFFPQAAFLDLYSCVTDWLSLKFPIFAIYNIFFSAYFWYSYHISKFTNTIFQLKMRMIIRVVPTYMYHKMLVSTLSLNSHLKNASSPRSSYIHGLDIQKVFHRSGGTRSLHIYYCLLAWIVK